MWHQIKNSPKAQYIKWRNHGGKSYNEVYYEFMLHDRNRDKLIEELTLKEVLQKLPHLVSSKQIVNKQNYKSYSHQSIFNNSDLIDLYWMNPSNRFGYCIEVYPDEKLKLRLRKG